MSPEARPQIDTVTQLKASVLRPRELPTGAIDYTEVLYSDTLLKPQLDEFLGSRFIKHDSSTPESVRIEDIPLAQGYRSFQLATDYLRQTHMNDQEVEELILTGCLVRNWHLFQKALMQQADSSLNMP